MTDEALVLEGAIRIPYRWTTGASVGRFLAALRDERTIHGVRCSACGRVLCPPQEYCGRCSAPTADWVPVGPQGTVSTFTVVRTPPREAPAPAPYALVACRLDGADTDLLHIVRETPERVAVGVRVEAVFAATRAGAFFDLQGFRVIEA